MIGEVKKTETGKYVRCAAQSGPVSTEQDLLDLLTYCYEIESNRVLLDDAHLPPDFFSLKTGLAGAIFQKFSNYQVKAAIVTNLAAIQSERFKQLISECNKGNWIHFFSDIAKAEEWLTT